MMEGLRGEADLVVDTSDLSPHDLRDRIRELFADAPPEAGLQVSLISFGFKYGAPRDADMILDVRFLPNPYWEPELKDLPGTDAQVQSFVGGQPLYRDFMTRLGSLLDVTVPGFLAEGKSYLTIAVGCTGGRHRSVVVVDELAEVFRDRGLPVTLDHRDLDRG
jgi:UPF0042 nucleotide-binding protein